MASRQIKLRIQLEEWGGIIKVKMDFVMSGSVKRDKIFGNENARSGSISRRPH